VDATNLTSATGTTTGGNYVLLSNVKTNNYVYYWNCSLYGNGFIYSLEGAPTNYSSSHGHGVLMTKNAILDNLVIEGDIYDMLTSREPVGVLYFLYVYMMPGNGVVYDMTVMEDGDALMYDLKISAENYFKASSPEWIDDVYRTQPTE